MAFAFPLGRAIVQRAATLFELAFEFLNRRGESFRGHRVDISNVLHCSAATLDQLLDVPDQPALPLMITHDGFPRIRRLNSVHDLTMIALRQLLAGTRAEHDKVQPRPFVFLGLG